MIVFLTILHIIITVSLISLVLIQDSKGDGMGAFGGAGNSNSVLGATGATSLAAKLTQWFAIAFAISCITLAMLTGRSKKSVVDGMAPVPPAAKVNSGPESKTPSTETTPPAQKAETTNTSPNDQKTSGKTSEQDASTKK